MACDGVWDVLSNQQAVDFVAGGLGFTGLGPPVGGVSPQSAALVCDDLLAESLARGSGDNLSVVLVVLGTPPLPDALASSGERPAEEASGLRLVAEEGEPAAPNGLRLLDSEEIELRPSPAGVVIASPAVTRVAEGQDLAEREAEEGGALVTPDKRPEEEPGICSPLNTAAGSSRVRKQLQFLE